MNTQDSRFKCALKAALSAPSSFKLGAVICKGNKVCASTFNIKGAHAETRCIKRCRKLFSRKRPKYDLLVVRVLASGELAISKPCDRCWEAIKSANIKRVYYIDIDKNIVCESV